MTELNGLGALVDELMTSDLLDGSCELTKRHMLK
jgi:hypothetical protein